MSMKRTVKSQNSFCCFASAAVYASARICLVSDTAIAVVSVLIGLLGLLVYPAFA